MLQLPLFRLPASSTRNDLVAKYFRVLGHPTRLRILELLQAEGELSAGEVTRRLDQLQPRISNHLARLRWCAFVDTHREHRIVYYRLADDRVVQIIVLAGGLLADNAEHVAVLANLGTEASGRQAVKGARVGNLSCRTLD
jgi:ArsR family transcriptional regulator, cadmium/lead-responsive transcriptional repressor